MKETKKRLPKDSNNDYSRDIINKRIKFLEEYTNSSIVDLNSFSIEPKNTKGNIENIIGFTQVPTGIIGPLKINGEHANGEFFIPMATLEGCLIKSYNRGAKLITLSGGVNVKVYNDSIQRAPVFIFKDLCKVQEFLKWMDSNFQLLKQIGESSSNNLKLVDCDNYLIGYAVYLRMKFTTNDAMGMNMITKACSEICKYILKNFEVEDFFLESNVAVDKKASYMNFINGRGKSVTAEVKIDKKYIHKILGTSPERMKKLFHYGIIGCSMSGTIGVNLHFANAIAAIFLACGQDMANVTESSVGMVNVDIINDDSLFCNNSTIACNWYYWWRNWFEYTERMFKYIGLLW